MSRPLPVIEDHRVGIWCRRFAWIILAIGLIRIALAIYNALFLNNISSPVNNFPAPYLMQQELLAVAAELTTLAEFLFFFFVLYAAAVVIEHLTGSTGEEDLEDLEEEDLEEEVPEQLQKQ